MGKGIAYFKTGRVAGAGAIFAGLRQDVPDDPEACWWFGRIAERRGDRVLAIDNYKNAVMLGGEGSAAHVRLARLYLLQGMYLRAREELQRAFAMFRM